jgi:hypothetical protein
MSSPLVCQERMMYKEDHPEIYNPFSLQEYELYCFQENEGEAIQDTLPSDQSLTEDDEWLNDLFKDDEPTAWNGFSPVALSTPPPQQTSALMDVEHPLFHNIFLIKVACLIELKDLVALTKVCKRIRGILYASEPTWLHHLGKKKKTEIAILVYKDNQDQVVY